MNKTFEAQQTTYLTFTFFLGARISCKFLGMKNSYAGKSVSSYRFCPFRIIMGRLIIHLRFVCIGRKVEQ